MSQFLHAGIIAGRRQLAALVALTLAGALPLFVSGLGVFGFLGWRRKRKAALAA